MLKVLLIDDEPILIRDMLIMFGYDVEVASDGYKGITLFSELSQQMDLVMLDLNMPLLNGWSVLKHIRDNEKNPHIPVIMLSSSGDEVAQISGLRRGADGYLTKPISPGKLIANIEAVSRRYKWGNSASPNVLEVNMSSLNSSASLLTPREKEIIEFIAKGDSNQRISQQLSISELTVKNHLAHIFKKLNVNNRTQLACVAREMKLVSN